MADITVKQYRKIDAINAKEGTKKWLIESVSIFCNISKAQTKKLTLDELNRIGAILKRLEDPDGNNQTLTRKINYKGLNYGFHPKLSDLTVGEFADLETYCERGMFENLNGIMSILYRPVKTDAGDFYTIEEYEGSKEENYWDELTMDIVLGAVNFFLSIGESLVKDSHSFLKAQEQKI